MQIKSPPADLASRELPLPQGQRFAAAEPQANDGPVQDGWLAQFEDAPLVALVDEAMAHNPDLQLAAARWNEASARVRVAASSLWPQVDGMGNASRVRNGDGQGTSNEYLVGGQVSWELDLWGRLRSGEAASEASAESVRLDYEMARLSLASAVADSWFVAIQARQQLAIDQERLAAEQRTARITGDKVKLGAGEGPLDADLAEANVRLAADAIERDQSAIEETRRALEVLLGRYPATELEVAAELPALPGETPIGVPSELLERRPDIVAADRQVAAAFHATESAKAAQLPRVTLSASLGSLINPSEGVWSTGADLLAPLFTGGRLRAEIDIATAQQKQAIAAYVSTAIAAFREVESALANEQFLARRQTELEHATARMTEASRVGENRYDAGLLSIVDLNVIRQQDFDSQSLLLQLRTDRLRERLRLYRALGGNFDVPTSI